MDLSEIDGWNKQSLVGFVKWLKEYKKEEFEKLLKEYDIQRKKNEE